jgi:hypothetical protein
VICAVGSVAMNYAAADVTSVRGVAAYVMPPVFRAIVTSRVIAVVCRHVPGMEAERSAWAGFTRARPRDLGCSRQAHPVRASPGPRAPSTLGGVRRWVLIATPLPGAPPGESALLSGRRYHPPRVPYSATRPARLPVATVITKPTPPRLEEPDS